MLWYILPCTETVGDQLEPPGRLLGWFIDDDASASELFSGHACLRSSLVLSSSSHSASTSAERSTGGTWTAPPQQHEMPRHSVWEEIPRSRGASQMGAITGGQLV